MGLAMKRHVLRICEVNILVPRSNVQAARKGRRVARHILFQIFLRETCSRSIAKRGGTVMKLQLSFYCGLNPASK